MIHDKDTLVAHTAVMRSKRLHKLALVADHVLFGRQQAQSVLKGLKIILSYLRVAQYLCYVL